MNEATIKRIIKRSTYISVIVIIIIIIGGYFFFRGDKESEINTATAVSGDITQEVTVTGKVKSSVTADLSFEKTGKITQIYVSVGDRVNAGATLLTLENGDVLANLNQVKAQLKIDEIKLNELKIGTRVEDIQVKEAELRNSTQVLENYYNDVRNTSENAYIKADDAVRIKTAGIFSGYKTSVYQFTYTTCAYDAESDARNLRLQSENILDNWKNEINKLAINTSRSDLEKALVLAKTNLDIIRTLLQKVNETLVTGCTIGDTSLDTYRTNVSTARTNVITATQNITSLEQSIQNQKLTIQKIQSELNLKLAGSSVEQVEAQEAQIMFSKARVESAEAELSKTIMRAPINGVVSKQDAKIGEVVSANKPIITLITDSAFEIEAFVPEADMSKVILGQKAVIDLDAFGDAVKFNVVVSKIEPAETVIEGISTYRVTLRFEKEDDRIKSGMTANIDILTGKKENVIKIPSRAVVSKDAVKSVSLLNLDGTTKEVEVVTGLRGSDGATEIISGLNEGDKVLVY